MKRFNLETHNGEELKQQAAAIEILRLEDGVQLPQDVSFPKLRQVILSCAYITDGDSQRLIAVVSGLQQQAPMLSQFELEVMPSMLFVGFMQKNLFACLAAMGDQVKQVVMGFPRNYTMNGKNSLFSSEHFEQVRSQLLPSCQLVMENSAYDNSRWLGSGTRGMAKTPAKSPAAAPDSPLKRNAPRAGGGAKDMELADLGAESDGKNSDGNKTKLPRKPTCAVM